MRISCIPVRLARRRDLKVLKRALPTKKTQNSQYTTRLVLFYGKKIFMITLYGFLPSSSTRESARNRSLHQQPEPCDLVRHVVRTFRSRDPLGTCSRSRCHAASGICVCQNRIEEIPFLIIQTSTLQFK